MPAPDYVGPRTPLEEALERAWAELLGLERVGVRDSFFELGGHSLLAAELFARLERAYGKRLPLSSLFPESTIERQAQLLAQATPVHHGSLVPIQPLGRRAPFICVHAIDGDVLRFEPLARLLGSEQPFYGLRARGLDPGSEPIADVEAMAAAYVDDLLRAGFGEPFYLGGFSSGATVAFEMARQLAERGHRASGPVRWTRADSTAGSCGTPLAERRESAS
jgi:acyl carrier protein